MRRLTVALQVKPGKKDEFLRRMKELQKTLPAELQRAGIGNFSVWSADNLALCYGEAAGGEPTDAEQAFMQNLPEGLQDCCVCLGSPIDRPMRLMYEDIGVVREDKSAIRHRVFITKLKPGCAEEYKLRHDALVASRGGRINPGPESNFTIWNAGDYIFGYCELDRAMERPAAEAPSEATVAWETRMLEIMDWVTDDVDWLTGMKHSAVECLFRQ